MTDLQKGKIIPFAQGSSFYMKRGAKEMEKNDLLAALNRYRQAYLSAPDQAEPCLAVSEILSQMQRFEESNRMLLLLMSSGNGTPECFFGLACNYFGMREYDGAAESLENYLEADPDGPFAMEAEDFLDMIDDDDAMYEMTGLKTDADYDDSASCMFAQNLMNAGDYAGAVRELSSQVEKTTDSLMVQNQLAIAYFCNGERNRALGLTTAILADHPKNVQALCNMALCLHETGDEKGAMEHLCVAETLKTELPEELHNICVLELELGRYEKALATLKHLLQILPYDENILHKMGYCCYMLGDTAGAQDCYRRILKIQPADTIAKYYLNQSKKTGLDEKIVRAHWMIPYQVPFSEAFRRLNQINKFLALPPDELLVLWQKDAHMQQLLQWALSLPEARVKKSMLSLLFSFGDERAQWMLRDYLLRTDQPDDLKRVVFGMLKRLSAPEPYMAYLNGQWIQGRVNMLEFPYKLPASYENVVQLLLQYMVGVREEDCVAAAAGIFHNYIESLQQEFPRISVTQELSLAAALEYLACKQCGVDISESEIEKAYRISSTRLHNALTKLGPFAKEQT
ncbi:MAG: tetratricopeptide repeat protein [Clostridia bacterium]